MKSRKKKTGGAYRRFKQMERLHAAKGKDRNKAKGGQNAKQSERFCDKRSEQSRRG